MGAQGWIHQRSVERLHLMGRAYELWCLNVLQKMARNQRRQHDGRERRALAAVPGHRHTQIWGLQLREQLAPRSRVPIWFMWLVLEMKQMTSTKKKKKKKKKEPAVFPPLKKKKKKKKS